MKPSLLAVVSTLFLGCASVPEASEEVRKIQQWEKSLRMELQWARPGVEKIPENAVLEIWADDLPRLGEGTHFVGQTYVEVDGYLVFMADISDSHSNIQNAGVLQWYKSMRSGTFQIHYRYTFYRSFSVGPNYQDRFRDWVVLHSGVKTITMKKG